jgi:formylglycine-generating enzyme required for sulfatase activity/predicted Ser/Thr protein kinase
MPESPAPRGHTPTDAGALPEQFGRYRILKKLGQGGMGTVYLALDTRLDRQVALKVPRLDPADGPEVLQRFLREARLAATLQHPNICPVHDVDQIDGVHYIAMGYLDGRPLSDLIDPDRPLPQHQAAALVRRLAKALQEAHARGIVHRDLKPSNVMITRRGEPVVMDFGLARRMSAEESRLTGGSRPLGTPAYMPPEQFSGGEGAVGTAWDVYSLGVIFYELLTGRLPFEGPPVAVIGQVLTREPPPPSKLRPGLDLALEAICLKAMARDPRQRHASMAELAAELKAALRAVPEVVPLPPADAETSGGPARETRPPAPETVPVAARAPHRSRRAEEPAPPRSAARATRPGKHPLAWLVAGLLFGLLLAVVVYLSTGTSTLQNTPTEISNSLGMSLVRIAGGRLWMGSPEDEEDRHEDEGPRHEVVISRTFFLGKHEVTQEQYRRVMGTNPSWFSAGGEGQAAVVNVDTDNFPVENVSWEDAAAFCRRLSELPAEQKAGRHYALPTEAEWEYACRAGTTTPFFFGSVLNGELANCDGDRPYRTDRKGPYLGRPAAVGRSQANAWGLCDMHGNVREWCADWYDPGYYGSGDRKDPHGPDHGTERVLRGGAWSSGAASCRSACRRHAATSVHDQSTGFRVCLRLD